MELTELAYFSENVAEMADFYGRLLNKEPVAQSENMAIFMVGHTKIFIHGSYTPQDGELVPTNHIAFTVADVDSACVELIQSGLTLEVAAKDYYWGRSAYLRDPDGHQIELTQAEQPAY